MEITGRITGIKYTTFVNNSLPEVKFSKFDINKIPPYCMITGDNFAYAVSKWVSPKRTRSYPYERVYNTLVASKKITVIPVLKDEGKKGDRDFIQWDTVSLMSLLDIYVILAYYNKADKNGNKITNQKFNNRYVVNKITELSDYHSSALHWNIAQLKDIHSVIDKAKNSYLKIRKKTGVELSDFSGIDKFKGKIGEDVSEFLNYSRIKAQNAQLRELKTIQPKELLLSKSKAKITIENYLGGRYYFTVDEVKARKGILYLIESKHSKNLLLPSRGDIKDGLIKMILYSNLAKVICNGKSVKSFPVLNLTSLKMKSEIYSYSAQNKVNNFFNLNKFTKSQKEFTEMLFEEANKNSFIVKLGGSTM